MSARVVVVAIAALLCAACAKTPQPVDLAADWPSELRAYPDVERDWTRSGDFVHRFNKLLEVHATFKSPEWRAAWVAMQAREKHLPPAERDALLAEHKAEHADHYEMLLLVSTYDGRENDLQKGDKSVWRVALIDDRGNQVVPSSIKRDRRPDSVIKAEHPLMNDFAQAYVVTFPRTIEVLRGDADRFSLRVSGSRGGVELTWQARDKAR